MPNNSSFCIRQSRLLSTLCLVLLPCFICAAVQPGKIGRASFWLTHILNRELKSVVLEDALIAKSAATVTDVRDNISGQGTASDYISDFSADGLYNWPVDKSPIKVCFSSGSAIPGYEQNSVRVLAGCFDEWCAASEGRLRWQRVHSAQAADIKVRWTDRVTERAEGTEAGRTRTYARLNTVTNRGTIDGADMILLTRLPERRFTDAEIRKAYLHEVGHAFGIAGHSHNRRDAMYFALSPLQSGHLDERDKATLDHLYGIGDVAKTTDSVVKTTDQPV